MQLICVVCTPSFIIDFDESHFLSYFKFNIPAELVTLLHGQTMVDHVSNMVDSILTMVFDPVLTMF